MPQNGFKQSCCSGYFAQPSILFFVRRCRKLMVLLAGGVGGTHIFARYLRLFSPCTDAANRLYSTPVSSLLIFFSFYLCADAANWL
jgi:hypothetical protein